MPEIEYIPLKTPEGRLIGHARVRGGHVEMRLREPVSGKALAITETGTAELSIGVRMPVSAALRAIALHERGRLTGCGFSRTSALTPDALRRRIQTLAPRPDGEKPKKADRLAAFVEEIAAGIPDITPRAIPDAPASEAAPVFTPAPEPAPVFAPAPEAAPVFAPASEAAPVFTPAPEPAPVFAPAPEPAPVFAPAPEPAPLFTPASEPAPVFAPAPEPAPTLADDTQPAPPAWDAASRAAMADRANAVFRRIDTPIEPVAFTPYAPPAAQEGAESPVYSPAQQWSREADELLAPLPSARYDPPVAEFIPNPFPHIFPGAEFSRGEGDALLGHWQRGQSRAEISAVPGPYSPQPPPALAGYTRYIRARTGGYWVRVTALS